MITQNIYMLGTKYTLMLKQWHLIVIALQKKERMLI